MYQLGPLHMTDEAFINLVLFRQFMTAMRTRLTRESTQIHTPIYVRESTQIHTPIYVQ